RDSWPRSARLDPHAGRLDRPMARGDEGEVLPSVRGASLRPGLGPADAPYRLDGHGEAGASSSGGSIPAVGPRHRGRGSSAQEPVEPELAVRRRPVEEVHAPPDRHAGPERYGRVVQPGKPPDAGPAPHVRSIPRTVRREGGP